MYYTFSLISNNDIFIVLQSVVPSSLKEYKKFARCRYKTSHAAMTVLTKVAKEYSQYLYPQNDLSDFSLNELPLKCSPSDKYFAKLVSRACEVFENRQLSQKEQTKELTKLLENILKLIYVTTLIHSA